MNDVVKKSAQCGKTITTFLSLCSIIDIDVKQCKKCGYIVMLDDDICDSCEHNEFEPLQ